MRNIFKNHDLGSKYKQPVKLSTQDKEAIYQALPSIKELCKIVAINELKLKTGFRQFFNETPYGTSVEYRLQEAKKLLIASELNINEISKKVGYKYAQNFTKAFGDRFGMPPKRAYEKENILLLKKTKPKSRKI